LYVIGIWIAVTALRRTRLWGGRSSEAKAFPCSDFGFRFFLLYIIGIWIDVAPLRRTRLWGGRSAEAKAFLRLDFGFCFFLTTLYQGSAWAEKEKPFRVAKWL
jgi:hypothetical protein